MNIPELFEQRQKLNAVAEQGTWPDKAMNLIVAGLIEIDDAIEQTPARSGADLAVKLRLLAEYAADTDSVYRPGPYMLRRFADEWQTLIAAR